LRKKLIDAARCLSKSALSLQMRAGRRDSIALGIENRYPITVVALVVKCKLVSMIAMCAGCHRDAHEKTKADAAMNSRRLLSRADITAQQ
jgi:cytochrome c553